MVWSPGLTFASVLKNAPVEYVRDLLGASLCRMLDLLAEGEAEEDRIRSVAAAVVDVESLLCVAESRARLFSYMPPGKLSELADRLDLPESDNPVKGLLQLAWTSPTRRLAGEFFGVIVEPPPAPPPERHGIDCHYGLFPHQRRAANRIRHLLDEGPRRGILHLPTGVGKTRTAMNLVCDYLRLTEPTVVVWLARGRELLEQAASEFERAWCQLGNRRVEVVRMWGTASVENANLADGIVFLGLDKAVSTLRTSSDFLTRLALNTRYVVFDEAHHAIAGTYQRVVDDLTVHHEARLLGLTATPGRTWADIDADGRLADYFARQKVTLEIEGYSNPVTALIEQGYLARPEFRTVTADPGIELTAADRAALADSFDIPTHVLAELAGDEQWNLQIVRTVLDLVKSHRRILVFAATVEHCRLLASILCAFGVDADYVTGMSSLRRRSHAIRRFSRVSEQPMVLFNYGVLTTGFDAPAASAAVIARPTASLVLYSQMVGRVLRGPKAGGTATCEIVTVVNTALPGFGDVAEAFTNWEDVWESR